MSASVGLFSIGGIASGLDTDTMIEQLMQLERRPVVRMENTQQELRRVDDAWGRINTKLSSLRKAIDAMAEPGRFGRLVAVESSDPDAVAVSAADTGGTGSVEFTVTRLAQSHQVSSGALASVDAPLDPGEVSVTVGGITTTVTLDGTQSLTDLAAELNNAEGGFGASVVTIADGQHRLVLSADETGSASTVTADGAGAAQLGTFTTLRQAQDAQLELGTDTTLTVTRASNTIDDLLPGAVITLRQPTTQPVTVTSEQDVDGAVGAVKGYVDALEGAIGALADATSYDPVTEQGGVLQGDPTARQLLSRLRDAVTAPLDDVTGLHSGYQVGVSIDRDGVLTLDESRLRSALEGGFDTVGRLFSGTDTSPGLASVMSDALEAAEGSDGMVARARQGLEQRIEMYQGRIEGYDTRLATRESTLRKQFTAMEVALSQLQAQGSWLTSQLGGLDAQMQQ